MFECQTFQQACEGPDLHYAGAMRCLLPVLVLLAACADPGPRPVWIKPGTSSSDAERSLLACQREAGLRFPERRGIATSPSVFIGGGIRNGNRFGGIGTAVEIYDFDRNEAPREAAFGACMNRLGFALDELPGCPPGIEVQVLQAQPFDTRGLCVANGRISAPVAPVR